MDHSKSRVEEHFLGEVLHTEGEPWTVTAQIGKTAITFKVDTGADVTGILASQFRKRKMGKLTNANERLMGAGHNPITTKERFRPTIHWKWK